MIFVFALFCCNILQLSWGSVIYQEVAKELQNNVESVTAGVLAVTKEVEEALFEYKRKKEEEFNGHQSNDFNILEMYEWYEKEGDKATKKCLSAQRNLQMIRAGYNENVQQCFKRVDRIVVKMEEKIKSLVKMAEKHANTVDLVVPCEQLDAQEECLSQAREQGKMRTDSMMASLQRFEILKRLTIYEINTNRDVCLSIAETYKNCEKDEIEVLRKCMSGDDDQQDQFA
ncbi:hypothetical protein GE061_007671 [Apolygus lucorum]|uniref:Protein TsetseEP domain-containing protein n=1 Tax=Apolygus lucorum TaxID=248454 RepID=A0A8S9WP49_APOLU|nr:hypothetical protein GE061_007671 [Apolygus lucorum]